MRAPPSTWVLWYELFDDMYLGTTRIYGVPHGVDYGEHL